MPIFNNIYHLREDKKCEASTSVNKGGGYVPTSVSIRTQSSHRSRRLKSGDGFFYKHP
jgi:hypothetical protein